MENKQDTLIILSPGFPANEADTTCLTPQQIFVKALHENFPLINIVVLAFHYPFYPDEYQWHGIKVISLGGKDKGKLFRVMIWVKALLLLKKLNREFKLTGLLSFWLGECAFVGNYFAKRNNLTHYSWLLGQDAKKGNKYFRWIKPNGSLLIALSDFIAAEVRKNYGIVPSNIIPPGIDPSLFSQTTMERDIDILGVGSLIPLKQFHLFVEAISDLKKIFPDIKAVICGDGSEMKNLQLMAAKLQLQDNLSFAGERLNYETLALMQRSKILLHPSAYEGFGYVIAEALYAGAHVVSFISPMKKISLHHHIVKNKAEMNEKLAVILKNNSRGHGPVLMYDINQVAVKMMSLFS